MSNRTQALDRRRLEKTKYRQFEGKDCWRRQTEASSMMETMLWSGAALMVVQ